jgi:hypothetical protein
MIFSDGSVCKSVLFTGSAGVPPAIVTQHVLQILTSYFVTVAGGTPDALPVKSALLQTDASLKAICGLLPPAPGAAACSAT